MTGPVRYTTARTAQPSRITIDLLQTGISPVFTKREILSVHPALIRVLISRSTGLTRAALDLAAAGPHTVQVAKNELIVEIVARGRTLGGTEVESAPWRFPITVCDGCTCGDLCGMDQMDAKADCQFGTDGHCRFIDSACH